MLVCRRFFWLLAKASVSPVHTAHSSFLYTVLLTLQNRFISTKSFTFPPLKPLKFLPTIIRLIILKSHLSVQRSWTARALSYPPRDTPFSSLLIRSIRPFVVVASTVWRSATSIIVLSLGWFTGTVILVFHLPWPPSSLSFVERRRSGPSWSAGRSVAVVVLVGLVVGGVVVVVGIALLLLLCSFNDLSVQEGHTGYDSIFDAMFPIEN